MADLLCPRHEVEAWWNNLLRAYVPTAYQRGLVNDLISRLTARDQALREAAAQVCDEKAHATKTPARAMGEYCAESIRTAPLGECPQCRAEVAR